MEKMKMCSSDLTLENIEKIAKLFPSVITESKDENGSLKKAVDFDLLKQELSNEIIESEKERYQLTWPGKKEAIVTANTPINKTLRPVKDDSVDWDKTQNIYIEGDNLEALKILQEGYLNKIKCIYIDPPYNTGKDFVYKDNFSQDKNEYDEESGQIDEEGNRLFQNNESNGRFHSDWLTMMYSRLKLARNLLSDEGVIFISIDDGELENLRSICNEIFGGSNFRNTILTRRRIKSLNSQFADNGLYSLNVGYEYVLIYAKSIDFLMKALRMKKNNAPEKGRWDVFWSNADRPTMRYDILGFTPQTGQWRNSKEKANVAIMNYQRYTIEFEEKMTLEEYSQMTGITDFIRRIPGGTGKNGGVQHWIAPSDTTLRTSNWTDIEVSQIGKEIDLPFDNPKSKQLVMELIKLADCKDEEIILDFFSGSATTAHAVMQLNAEDGGSRKYIMVQLPEKCAEDSEAYKAGYKNICEIGKERICRAAQKIKDETNADIDYGFRVFKVDSSNMKDVYYMPEHLKQNDLELFESNIKDDRNGDDLLIQVMLDFGLELSLPLETKNISGNNIHFAAVNSLAACFDEKISESAIKNIAKEKPLRAVFRDSSFKDDAARINVEEIFKMLSPATEIKVI